MFMTDEHIIAYLLQELTEEEAERFEEQCFAQEEWPADIDSVEQELIDAYLRNDLTKDRHRRFEEKYLITDARKARVLTAQSFLEVLCPPQKTTLKKKLKAIWQRPLVPQTAVVVWGPQVWVGMPQIAIAVLIVAVLAPLLIFYFMSAKTFTQLDLTMTSTERGSGPKIERVNLPLSTDVLKITLKLPEPLPPDTATYRVEWGNLKVNLGELKIVSQDSQSIVVIIPARQLSPGQYALKLFKTNRGETEQHLPGNYRFIAEETAPTR